MSEKIFYPSKEDYQALEDFICGNEQQQLYPDITINYPPTYTYYPPTYTYYPPTYTYYPPIYPSWTTTCSSSTNEAVYPSGDKFIFYA
jgi:hypothetical protein